MTTTLLYLSYGPDKYQQEVMFSILSARRFLGDDDRLNIVVYTDKTELFAWLNVETRELTSDLLDEWVGGGYPFRRKIACLITALNVDGGRIALVDGDTYFLQSPMRLFDRIGPGRACLHMREIRLSRRPNTAGLMLGDLLAKGGICDLNGNPVRLRPRESMWNSGVIGIDAHDRGRIDEALHLVDEIWRHEQRVHTLEQFALGHVLAEARLSEVDDIVFHYWPHWFRTDFLAKLPDVLDQARPLPLDEAAKWSYDQRPRASLVRRAASKVRDAGHWAGSDHRWTRTSS